LKCEKPFWIGSDVVLYCKGKVSLGSNCVLSNHSRIICYEGGEISVGKNSPVGWGCLIAAHKRIIIGNDVLMGELVSIRDHDHRFVYSKKPFRLQDNVLDPVVIGNNVWIAAKVTITAGVVIGDNCVIGANAVVTHSIPANSIATGIPATVRGTIPEDKGSDDSLVKTDNS